jgi:glycosyltransferase involved in cell wall biosynthesis
MNDAGRRHAYPERVRFEIAETDISSYRRAADFLNVNPGDVVSVQHEYGIFGGKAGSHLLTLLGELRMPIVTTLHTVLAEPDPLQRVVMNELVRLSERLVVMSERGRSLLREVHRAPESKIDLIPHGIPDVPSACGNKTQLGVGDRSVILTFGLLSPDKGIEHVIDALPAILDLHPNTVYIVLGATHPHVKEQQGETYRMMLEARAERLGVASSIIFHNRFVSVEELTQFLAAADIYITPYLKPAQITSGTLAYAVGSGKAVISTPYWYATELLADGRGVLLPWPKDDRGAIAREVIALLGDDGARRAMGARAAAYGRGMRWPEVARAYVRSFERARVEHADRLRAVFRARTLAERPAELPEVNLDHLSLMTDDTGLLQHAAFNVPRLEDGYCLDDNARALLVMAMIEEAGSEDARTPRRLASRYLAFVNHAFNVPLGRFRNFMSFGRRFTEECGSEDSHGRALWALGAVVGRSRDPGRQSLAGQLFHAALPATAQFTSPRAWAYSLLGIAEYLAAFGGDRDVQAVRKLLVERLYRLLQRTRARDWPWFENGLAYCNPRLPQALIVSGAAADDREMVSAGTSSLFWLASLQRSDDGYFAPIGSNGFYPRGGEKAAFDQQPVEACAMVSAALSAHRLTGDAVWAKEARRAFTWFLGQNQLHASLYEARSGGCRDGLHADRPNENQGGESTVSFLMALLEMRAAAARTIAS